MTCTATRKSNLLQVAIEAVIKEVITTFEARREKRRTRKRCECCHACASTTATHSLDARDSEHGCPEDHDGSSEK